MKKEHIQTEIALILREELTKAQDLANKSASDTYSKLHQEMKFELTDFKNQFVLHKNDMKHLAEKFENHMINEEMAFKKVMEILEKKADKWVESSLLRVMWMIIGTVILSLLGLIFVK